MDVTTVGSPGWWAARLYKKLKDRRPELEVLQAYYSGDHPLPEVPDQLKNEVTRFLKKCRANYMKLVIRAPYERLRIDGFRFSQGTEAVDGQPSPAQLAEAKAQDIWQASKMDLRSRQGILEALKFKTSYLMVGPGAELPLMTIESPYQCIVEKTPGSDTQRDAGLKVWIDDRQNLLMATLYLRAMDGNPPLIYKWQGSKGSSPRTWVKRDGLPEGEDWPLINPIDTVPLIPLENRPELGAGGVSELEDVMDIQDRLNLTLVDRMLTQVYGAFPQRYGTNWPLGKDEINPETGKAEPNPVDIGRGRLIRVPTDVKFGSFMPADLDPILAAKTSDVRDIASLKSIPVSYLLGDLVNVSAEAQQVAESGLISVAGDMQIAFGEAFEEGVSLAMQYDGAPPDATIHTIWADPQYRSIAQQTDAVVKQFAAGLITLEVAQSKLGYGPQEIKSMASELRAKQLQEAAALSLGNALSQAAAPAEPALA